MGKIGLLPEGNYADCANGYRIHYLDEGEGEVVVFLHGSGPGASGYSNFKGNYPFLVDAGYRCIIPDHIGYGFSDKPDDVDHPLSFFVECIKQTLDCAGVDKCTLVGNSLGGAIAFGLALDYPELVEKLILMAPGGLSELAEYQKMPGMQKVFQVFGSGEPVTPAVMKDLFATGLMHNPALATDELVAERMQIMEIMNGHVMATMQVPVLVDRLAEISCPTLGFWGMDEKMMPEEGIMAMVKNIRHMRTILVNECGHWVMVEHEGMFNRACLDFLQNG
ncbi:alpha/beta fold hydrolase [Seongchinamella sediminis]|uniref:Alpha/beta fold hydrolase n=1 Tax=Seongchinamella sediminis TaxID=2283635 RepID=A0A3L7E0D6_9GAMM|nr:alpha/beta hydrolase [Seongchinamella sediminis]RLQ21582.1 alpha/beta fold hydrolase [Seongchinamella sediminis]